MVIERSGNECPSAAAERGELIHRVVAGGHGSHFHRVPGSVGQCATPSRVFKGLRLPGHMGCDTVTTKNLEVVKVDEEQNLILVKGAVPGGKNAMVRIRLA